MCMLRSIYNASLPERVHNITKCTAYRISPCAMGLILEGTCCFQVQSVVYISLHLTIPPRVLHFSATDREGYKKGDDYYMSSYER